MVFCEFKPEATLEILGRFILHDLAKIINNFLSFGEKVYLSIDKIVIDPLNDFFPDEAAQEEPVKLYYERHDGKISFEVNTHKETIIYYPFSFLHIKEINKANGYNGYTNFEMWKINIEDKLYISGFSYFLDPKKITKTLRLYPAVLDLVPVKPGKLGLFCTFINETKIESCVIQ